MACTYFAFPGERRLFKLCRLVYTISMNPLATPPHFGSRPIQGLLFPIEKPYLRFVIHLHHATHVHYDLRFELGDVLKDFVIPKGPSTNPLIRRLAIPCRDHAKSLLQFEGRIRPERYGAGPLLIWDGGYYAACGVPGIPQEELIWAGIEEGYLELEFFGQKVRGRWRLYLSGGNWYFQKLQDQFASSQDVLLQDWSIVTGRTIQEL